MAEWFNGNCIGRMETVTVSYLDMRFSSGQLLSKTGFVKFVPSSSGVAFANEPGLQNALRNALKIHKER